MRFFDQRPQIGDLAAIVRILHEQPEGLVHGQRGRSADLEPDAERFGAAPNHVNRLRKAAIGHQEHALVTGRRLLRLQPVEHRHRLGRGRAFVEQRCRGDVHSGKVFDDCLKVQQRFETALGDLRLIGRVGRVPTGILEDVSEDDAGRHAVVVAHPDVRARSDVTRRDRAEAPEIPMLGVRFGKIERRRQSNARRNRLLDERINRRNANSAQHGVPRRSVGTDVPGLKGTLNLVGH